MCIYKHHAHIMGFFLATVYMAFPNCRSVAPGLKKKKIRMDDLGEQLTAQPFEVKTGVRQECLINFFSDQKQSIQTCI